MPDRCCIPECRAISGTQHGKISVFRIPKDPALRTKWLKSIGRKNWNPAEKAVICEKHFEPSCITKPDRGVKRARPILHAGALPTIFNKMTMVGKVPIECFKPRARKTAMIKNSALEKRIRNRKRRRRGNRDSMPLAQRLNLMGNTSAAEEIQPNPPTLKSQPISPTKLKVTRQSTSKSTQLAANDETARPTLAAPAEEVCLKWNSHHSNMQTAFPSLLSKEQYCDVTLVADGRSLKCHKLILSSCSSYFDQVLEKIMPYQHPVIFMKDIPFDILKYLCTFMYTGEVNIQQKDLDQLLAVADSLKIKGLANKEDPIEMPPAPVKEKEPVVIQPPKPNKTASRPPISRSRTPISRSKTPVPRSKTPIPRSKPTVPSKKNADITDPLDLLEPTYEEAATPDKPLTIRRSDPVRKSTGRRVRKRKHVVDDEHESSPPVFHTRKGTRSRPNVKVPRYFNASFDNSNTAKAAKMSDDAAPTAPDTSTEESYIEPFIDMVDEIKTEPVDIEDSQLSYEGDETFDMLLVEEERRDEAGGFEEVPTDVTPLFPKVDVPTTSRLTVLAKVEGYEVSADPLRDDLAAVTQTVEKRKEAVEAVNGDADRSSDDNPETSNVPLPEKLPPENSVKGDAMIVEQNLEAIVPLNGDSKIVESLHDENMETEDHQETTVENLQEENVEEETHQETDVNNHEEGTEEYFSENLSNQEEQVVNRENQETEVNNHEGGTEEHSSENFINQDEQVDNHDENIEQLVQENFSYQEGVVSTSVEQSLDTSESNVT